MPKEDPVVISKLQSRRISFPPEAIFQSVIQYGDNQELWTILQNWQQLGIDIDQHNHTGITPLHQSVLNNNLDAVKMLLNFGAEVNFADSNWISPLHTAAACGFLQVASILIMFGADLFAKTKHGDLPIDLATDEGLTSMLHSEMIRIIHRKEYTKSLVIYHARELISWIFYIITVIVQDAACIVQTTFHSYLNRHHGREVNNVPTMDKKDN